MNSGNQLKRDLLPWIMWGLGAAFFFTDYLARVSPGVMSVELMREFQVSGLALGSLSMFFFYPYLIMQIPAGVIADRIGPRYTLIGAVLICSAASFFFAHADEFSTALIGRFLLGFGGAFAFVCALKLAANWFPAERIGLLAGLTQMLGMLGAAAGERPVAVLTTMIGWRSTIQLIGGLFIFLTLLIILIVRDRPKALKKPQYTGEEVAQETRRRFTRGIKLVLTNKQSWLVGIYSGLLFAPTAAFAELWGNHFLRTAYQFDIETAATCIGVIFLGWSCGAPIIGWLSDRVSLRKPFMLFSALASFVTLMAVIYVPNLPLGALVALLFLYGVSNTGVVIAYACASEINSHKLAGTSLGMANMLSIIVGACFQPLIGWFLDLHRTVSSQTLYSVPDFYVAFVALPICLLLAVVCWWLIKETHCRSQQPGF